MSQERFDWLDRWCERPAEDVIRTPGTESNVKEIYDACNELARDPANIVLNQFCEFGNHLGHYEVTGRALEHVVDVAGAGRGWRLAAFVSATGSAGTIAAGDRLKDTFGSKIVAVEALECPTMLENGYGEHNIQGIGDKHIPLIHNVMNTDVVVGISDARDRRAGPPVQLGRRSSVPGRPQGGPGGDHRRPRPLRVLVDLQRAGGDQDGQGARARGGRGDRDGGHRRRGDVPERAGRPAGRARSVVSSPTSMRPRSSGATSATSTPTT